MLVTMGLLSACTSPVEAPVIGTTWQITNIWLEPGEPSGLPGSAAGRANLVFGETSITGYSSCSAIQGSVSFTKEGEPASAEEADAISFGQVEIEPPEDNCASIRTHEQLVELLSPGSAFDLRHQNDFELILTQQVEILDRPAIGLSAV
ncbi:hypothetical protein C5L39_00330 [Corynebacterium alimapuense]|uniref:META domain-containing protein n=2 Tax=Corynebacterium alimapuense TaxID=1576874 RepID=A0A3M8KBU8_9CORY|nr:hypothetical protein C5L39_00330 [Corynebacterium alimapuense]